MTVEELYAGGWSRNAYCDVVIGDSVISFTERGDHVDLAMRFNGSVVVDGQGYYPLVADQAHLRPARTSSIFDGWGRR